MQENIQENMTSGNGNTDNMAEAYEAIVKNIERHQSQAYKGVPKTDIFDLLNNAYISLSESTIDLADKSIEECTKLLYHSLNLQRGKYFRKNGSTKAIFQNDVFTVDVSEQESKSILENIAAKNDYTAYDCDAVFSYVSEKLKLNGKLNEFFNCYHDSFLEYEKIKDIYGKIRTDLDMKANTISNRLNSLRNMFCNDENIINYFEDCNKEVQEGNTHQKARYGEYASLDIEAREKLAEAKKTEKKKDTVKKKETTHIQIKEKNQLTKKDYALICSGVKQSKETNKAGFKIIAPEKAIGCITAKNESFKPPHHKEGNTQKHFVTDGYGLKLLPFVNIKQERTQAFECKYTLKPPIKKMNPKMYNYFNIVYASFKVIVAINKKTA